MYALIKEDLHFVRDLVTFNLTLLQRRSYKECNVIFPATFTIHFQYETAWVSIRWVYG